MTVRETSTEAYRVVMESGYVSARLRETYRALYEHGPCTGSELFYRTADRRNPTHSNIVTRLGELREKGLVRELPKRPCRVTGFMAIEWDVTPKVIDGPIARSAARRPRRGVLLARIAELEKENERLRAPRDWTQTEFPV